MPSLVYRDDSRNRIHGQTNRSFFYLYAIGGHGSQRLGDYFWKVRQAVSVLELSRFRDNSRERVLEGHLVFFSPMSSLGLLAPTTRSWASGER